MCGCFGIKTIPLWLCESGELPEGLEGVVADGHAGGEVELFEFGAALAEADAGAVCDLGAAVQVQNFDVPAVLSKRPEKQPRRRRTGVTRELLAAA